MREAIIGVLRDVPEVEFAYLFGSQLGGVVRSDSDWDVAIYLDEHLTSEQRQALVGRIVSSVPRDLDLDLIVLNESPPLLAHRALQGEQLFVRNRDLFARVFVRVLGESMDEAWWRDFH